MNTQDTLKRLARTVIKLERHVKPSTALEPSDADVAAWLDDRSPMALPEDSTNIYERALADVVRLAKFLRTRGFVPSADGGHSPVDIAMRLIETSIVVSPAPGMMQGARHPGEDVVSGGVGATDGGH